MDISKGIVEIDNELVVKPNFTFEQFKETKYYTNQDTTSKAESTDKKKKN